MKSWHLLSFGLTLTAASLFAQTTQHFGVNITGQLTLQSTQNALQLSQAQSAPPADPQCPWPQSGGGSPSIRAADDVRTAGLPRYGRRQEIEEPLRPQFGATESHLSGMSPKLGRPVSPTSTSFGFMGMTAYDHRYNANAGNQLNVEPPSQGLAVANGYVVEGVNNAFQVYSTAGLPLLPKVISTNQLFGMTPACTRVPGANVDSCLILGPDPTDIRVFYDQTLNRFFVVQRVQDDAQHSHIWIAVSQTGDPTGTYNVYSMDTTNPVLPGGLFVPACEVFGCISDYPEIGADQYGIFLSWNIYSAAALTGQPPAAVIIAIDKASLANNAASPNVWEFTLQRNTNFEFAVQPAVTPPGGFFFVANNGLEYFVSTEFSTLGSQVAVWAMVNTSFLSSTNPSARLELFQINIPTNISYQAGDPIPQPSGPIPLGTAFGDSLEYLDPGDTRVQSVEYVNGELYVTLQTLYTDDNGQTVLAAAYMILAPIFRGGTPNAAVLTQGYVYVNTDSVLRPAMAVNPQGKGAIVFTLVGPDYYPSAAFVTVNGLSIGSSIQIAGAGGGPDDGFSGYQAFGYDAPARWGDYSAALAASDGSIWMGTEFIPSPSVPRCRDANWATYLINYKP